MRKSRLEKLRESKKGRFKLVEMNSLDDLLKLLVDPLREPEERRLNNTQRNFIYSPTRIKAYKGPAGCAKTSTLAAQGMARALLMPGSKGLVARNDYNDLMDTTKLRMEEMLAALPKGTLLDRDKSPPEKWYIQPAGIRLADGSINDTPSQITFMGLKDSMGSYEFDWAIIDEADEVDEKRVHEVNTRLRHRIGSYSLSLAFNPPDVNHWLYTACTGQDNQGRKVIEPWIQLFSPEPRENTRNLPDGYYEQLSASLPEDMRIRLVDGEWGATFPGDPVIRQFRRNTHVRSGLPFFNDATLFRFWDFGYNRPACLWAQVSFDGRVHVLRELLGKQQEATQFARHVKAATAQTFPTAQRIVDYGDIAVRQKKDTGSTQAALMAEGITILCNRMGIDESLRKVRKLFETMIEGQPGILIDTKCPILIGGLSGGYHLKDDGVTPVKDGYYDHEMDALRYGIWGVLGTNATTYGLQLPQSIAYQD